MIVVGAMALAAVTGCDRETAPVERDPPTEAQPRPEPSAASERFDTDVPDTGVVSDGPESTAAASAATSERRDPNGAEVLAVAPPVTPSTIAEPVVEPVVEDVPTAADGLGVISAALAADGTLALPAALSMVAAGYRPLPGVTSASSVISDSGAALRTVVAHLDQLSSDQRQAVIAIVDPPGVSPEEAADGVGLIADAAGLVTLSSARFAEVLGTGLPSDVRITLVELPYANPDGTRNFSAPQTQATALAVSSTPDDRYDECRIRINTDTATSGAADPTFTAAIAQETFHCFQFAQRPNGEEVPLWAFEGAAAFAGEAFAQGTARSTPWWTRWITEPERPLEQRTFDALGFFALVDRIGLDAHGLAMALLSDASPESVRRRLEGRGVFDRWGSQSINDPTWNTAGDFFSVAGLDMVGLDPTLATLRPTVRQVTLTANGPSVSAASPTGAMSAAPWLFTGADGVVIVTAGPGDHGRLRWLDGTEWDLATGTQAFCTLPAGCVCPNAPAESAVAQPVTAVDVFVGVGPFSGDGPDVALRSLDAWCRETTPTASPVGAADACLIRDWTSTGYQAPFLAAGETVTTGGDGIRLRFADDGTVTIDLTEVQPVVIETDGGVGVVTTTTLTYQGRGAGRWGVRDGIVTITEVPANALTVRVTIDAEDGGRLTDVTMALGDEQLSSFAPIGGTARAECTEVGLTLAGAIPTAAGPAAFTFT